MSKWRRLRVVVEVPVRDDSNYTEKDLAWDVNRLVGDAKLVSGRLGRAVPRMGKVEIKQMNKVLAHAMRQQVERRSDNVAEEIAKIAVVRKAMRKAGLGGSAQDGFGPADD